jgi:hypothetical protein
VTSGIFWVEFIHGGAGVANLLRTRNKFDGINILSFDSGEMVWVNGSNLAQENGRLGMQPELCLPAR